MEYINIKDISILCEYHKSTRAKRLIITILKTKIKVTVPNRISIKRAQAFVKEQKEWIYESFIRIRKVAEQYSYMDRKELNELPFLGNKYPVEKEIGSKFKIIFVNGKFKLSIPKELDQIRINEYLDKWYKEQARIVFLNKINAYADVMNVEYNKVYLKAQKTRWGSCSSKKNINLNWRLIYLKEKLIDYVVVHELAHLKFFNHSKRFWTFVGSVLPDYSNSREALKGYGIILSD